LIFYFFRKLLPTFLFLVLFTAVICKDELVPEFTNYADDGIYRIDIMIILKARYNNDEKAACVTEDLKQRKVIAKFYHPILANHHGQLLEKLEPYLMKSEEVCLKIPDPTPEPTPDPTPEPTPDPTPDSTSEPTPKPDVINEAEGSGSITVQFKLSIILCSILFTIGTRMF